MSKELLKCNAIDLAKNSSLEFKYLMLSGLRGDRSLFKRNRLEDDLYFYSSDYDLAIHFSKIMPVDKQEQYSVRFVDNPPEEYASVRPDIKNGYEHTVYVEKVIVTGYLIIFRLIKIQILINEYFEMKFKVENTGEDITYDVKKMKFQQDNFRRTLLRYFSYYRNKKYYYELKLDTYTRDSIVELIKDVVNDNSLSEEVGETLKHLFYFCNHVEEDNKRTIMGAAIYEFAEKFGL